MHTCFQGLEHITLREFPIKQNFIHTVVDPCLKVKCEFNGKCNSRPERTYECLCPICDSGSMTQAVCGSDGKTYASHCHLKFASCKTKKKITVINDEPCGKCLIDCLQKFYT